MLDSCIHSQTKVSDHCQQKTLPVNLSENLDSCCLYWLPCTQSGPDEKQEHQGHCFAEVQSQPRQTRHPLKIKHREIVKRLLPQDLSSQVLTGIKWPTCNKSIYFNLAHCCR